MSTRVDVEEIEVTRGEYVLAFVLGVFLLVGGLWAYFQIDDVVRDETFRDPAAALTAPERTTLNRRDAAVRRAATARARARARRAALVDSREAYRPRSTRDGRTRAWSASTARIRRATRPRWRSAGGAPPRRAPRGPPRDRWTPGWPGSSARRTSGPRTSGAGTSSSRRGCGSCSCSGCWRRRSR